MDLIFNRTKIGQEHNDLCRYVHEFSENVINERRQSLVRTCIIDLCFPVIEIFAIDNKPTYTWGRQYSSCIMILQFKFDQQVNNK